MRDFAITYIAHVTPMQTCMRAKAKISRNEVVVTCWF
jgi:hypothetical protein